MTGTAVLLPVRSFSDAKTRLSDALSPQQRHDLAVRCAARVLRAAGRLPVVVMTDDAEVAGWAASCGAETTPDRGSDLSSSVTAAVAALHERGAARVVIAHGDLPLADDLTWIEEHEGVVIVPDRRADGTNVLAVPAGAGFRFAYGVASSHHHDGEALRLGLDVTVIRDPLLAWDIDVPEDLWLPEGRQLADLQSASLRLRRRPDAHAVAGR